MAKQAAKAKDQAAKERAAAAKEAEKSAGEKREARPQAAGAKTDPRAELRQAKGKQPLLLVFGASWDASTKALEKSLADAKVQSALGDRRVVWIDTDQHGAIADEYEVQQIPHMVLLDAAGQRAGVIEGFQPPEMLAEKLAGGSGGAAAAKPTRAAQPSERPQPARPAPSRAPATEAPAKEPAAGERDLQGEIRALREEIRELRAMLQELTRERRR
jgi:thioredoxin-like negative regulator of GroEL